MGWTLSFMANTSILKLNYFRLKLNAKINQKINVWLIFFGILLIFGQVTFNKILTAQLVLLDFARKIILNIMVQIGERNR
jgi:hypothetical protein